MNILNKVVLITVLVIVGAVMIGVINEYTEDDTNPLKTWQYDDYVIADGVEGATGAIELTTIGSQDYLHAIDVGEASITYTNGTIETIQVGKAYLDLFLMMGQSNAAYTQPNRTLSEPIPPIGTSYFYGTANAPVYLYDWDPSDCAMHDVTATDGTANVGDKIPAFCATYYNKTGHKVYWVTAGVGGQSITKFQPTNGQMWIHTREVLENAILAIDSDYYDYSAKAYFWIQGEQDSNMTVPEYIERFKEIDHAITHGDLGIKFDTCILSQIRKPSGPTAWAADSIIADSFSNVYMGSTAATTFTKANGLMNSDNVHYSPLGNNIIGTDLANCAAALFHPAPGDAIDLELISVIPVLIIVAILMAAIGMVVVRRNGD